MSLQELIDLNKIVFGVDLPKISLFNSSENFLNRNYENIFFYTGLPSFTYVEFTYRLPGKESENFSKMVSFDEYFNLKDLFFADAIIEELFIGDFYSRLHIDASFEMSIEKTPTELSLNFDYDSKKGSGYFDGFSLDSLLVDKSGTYFQCKQRAYVIEYDQSKILKI